MTTRVGLKGPTGFFSPIFGGRNCFSLYILYILVNEKWGGGKKISRPTDWPYFLPIRRTRNDFTLKGGLTSTCFSDKTRIIFLIGEGGIRGVGPHAKERDRRLQRRSARH